MKEQLPADCRLTILKQEGRFYPVLASSLSRSCIIPIYWETANARQAPYAQGRQPKEGVISFRTRKEAVNYCLRDNEHYSFLVEWEELTSRSEIYPERNVWYREEIGRYSRHRVHLFPSTTDVYAGVILDDDTLIHVDGETIDDAYVRLYEAVCEQRARTLLLAEMIQS